MPTSFGSVTHVVRLSPTEQVFRIHARWVVAGVPDDKVRVEPTVVVGEDDPVNKNSTETSVARAASLTPVCPATVLLNTPA
jgi:hypothetical protein